MRSEAATSGKVQGEAEKQRKKKAEKKSEQREDEGEDQSVSVCHCAAAGAMSRGLFVITVCS